MNPASKQCNRCGRILPSPATRDQIHEIRDRFTHRPNHVIWIVLDALTRAEKDADECHAMHRAETRRAEQAEQRVRELEAEVQGRKEWIATLDEENERLEERVRVLEPYYEINHQLQGELGVKGEMLHQAQSRIEQLKAALRGVESLERTYGPDEMCAQTMANMARAALARPTATPGEQG